MSGACEAEWRARPLSGGLWTLFSWLRRADHSSTESVSSAGSARTARSFAFLPGARCGLPAPARRSPPPPSASYQRRVRERSLRRQRDRDLTLHRKYGLYGLGYDSGSLPTGARDRRAVSESPRAHVPGKRRAPPPPGPVAATLPRRRARKRPAPPPPTLAAPPPRARDDPPMSRLPQSEERPRTRDDTTGCKPEKYSKRDAQSKETKEVKLRSEKSFLKQIFENKKRNSAIDTSTVKLLPSISELDKQAAEMIEKYRLKEIPPGDVVEREAGKMEPVAGSSTRQAEAWICTRCLKKYDCSVITCNYCLPLNKRSDSHKSSKISDGSQTKSSINGAPPGSSGGNIEDKERLKEMLKEMKDNLPKRPKSELITVNRTKNIREIDAKENYPKVMEAATLRIGSTINNMDKKSDALASTSSNGYEKSAAPPSILNKNSTDNIVLETIKSVTITQPVVLEHTKDNVVSNKSNIHIENRDRSQKNTGVNKLLPRCVNNNKTETEKLNLTNEPKPLDGISRPKYDLSTPLKISSLLNPIYIPKTTSTANTQTTQVVKQEVKLINKEKPTSEPQPNTEEIIRKLIGPPTQIKSTTAQTKVETAVETKAKVDTKVLPINKSVVGSKLQQETKQLPVNDFTTKTDSDNTKNKNVEVKNSVYIVTASSKDSFAEISSVPSTSKEGRLDQHARRRDLINKLEQSIAKGDEQAAAEAAVKLAQLKLSCSVLSFSSQIVADAPGCSTSASQTSAASSSKEDQKTEMKKVEDATQKSSQITKTEVEPVSSKQTSDNDLKQQSNKLTKQPINESQMIKQNLKPNGIIPKVETVNLTQSASNSTTNSKLTKAPVLSEASTSRTDTANVKLEKPNEEEVSILIWVEDKEATRGPVQLHIGRGATLGELRARAERALGLAARLQRWIVGRALCTDDAAPLAALAGPRLDAPFYLCLVEPDSKTSQGPRVETEARDPSEVYRELVDLEKQALVANAERFECGVCTEPCEAGAGVVLRECVHAFCRECLAGAARHCEHAALPCPQPGCRAAVQERELRALLPAAEYERWLARGLAAAESGSRGAFHCRTRDCAGWALCDPGVRRFPCPLCRANNCIPCQAIHEGETCEQHRARLEAAAARGESETDEGTRALLEALIARGEALECPQCRAIITKKWGCDWIKCSACKTEICWVTRGRRWGPAGRGDTSAGCRCGVDGKRCHPSCSYCH